MKKLNKGFEAFENIDDKTAEYLADRVILGDAEKKRMLEISMRKIDCHNKNNDAENYEESVSGVEIKNKKSYGKYAAWAASFLLVAGLGGVTLLNMQKSDENPLSESVSSITEQAVHSKTSKVAGEPSASAKKTTPAVTKASAIKHENAAVEPPAAPTTASALESGSEEDSQSEREIENEPSPPPPTEPERVEQENPEEIIDLPPEVVEPNIPYEPLTESVTNEQQIHWPNIALPVEEPEEITDSEQERIDVATLDSVLASLSYQPYTCDGLPEFVHESRDGTVYQINYSSRWVWRNGCEEAVLTDAAADYIFNYFMVIYGLDE